MNEAERDAYLLFCERCGLPADVDWIEIATFGKPTTYRIREAPCTTPGCYDGDGSRRVPLPPAPGELTRADRARLRFHGRLTRA